MNKYAATDKITVVIDFKGQPVHIELEKVKKSENAELISAFLVFNYISSTDKLNF